LENLKAHSRKNCKSENKTCILKDKNVEKNINKNEIDKRLNSNVKISSKFDKEISFFKKNLPQYGKSFQKLVSEITPQKIKSIKELISDYTKKQNSVTKKAIFNCKRSTFSESTNSNKSLKVINKSKEPTSHMMHKEIRAKFKDSSTNLLQTSSHNILKHKIDQALVKYILIIKLVHQQKDKRNQRNRLHKSLEKSFFTSNNQNSFSKSFNYETYGSNNTIKRKNSSNVSDETLTVRRSKTKALNKYETSNYYNTCKSVNQEEIDSIEEIHLVFINIMKKIKQTNTNFEKLIINESKMNEYELIKYTDSTIN
jgi:hypothetical protein